MINTIKITGKYADLVGRQPTNEETNNAVDALSVIASVRTKNGELRV